MSEKVYYFSDVLCIWAYVAHARLMEMANQFGEKVEIDGRFCSVFPDAHTKIKSVWKTRGEFEGFNSHLMEVAEKFPHVTVSKRIWLEAKPRTSTSPHGFLKAIQMIEEEDGNAAVPLPFAETLYNKATWDIRCAFFRDARDISSWDVQCEIAEQLCMDSARIKEKLQSAQAIARLDADYQLSDSHQIEGSPTFMMNQGRQKLYGNVGYKLIEANVEEMLRNPNKDTASWC